MVRKRKKFLRWVRDELRRQGREMPEHPSMAELRAALQEHGLKPTMVLKAAAAASRGAVKAQAEWLATKPQPGEQFVDGSFTKARRPVIKIKRRRAIDAAEVSK